MEEQNEGHKDIDVRRGKFDSLSLYEVTDYELEILERGSPSSLLLNFAILGFSVGVSFLISLLTLEFTSVYTFAFFLTFSLVGLFSSVVLIFIWWKIRANSISVCAKIKNRLVHAPAPYFPTIPTPISDEVEGN